MRKTTCSHKILKLHFYFDKLLNQILGMFVLILMYFVWIVTTNGRVYRPSGPWTCPPLISNRDYEVISAQITLLGGSFGSRVNNTMVPKIIVHKTKLIIEGVLRKRCHNMPSRRYFLHNVFVLYLTGSG